MAPVESVPEESIRAIQPHLSPQVAAMIQLQHLCGARPQEVVTIRPCEVETGGDVWLYQPRHHKMEHFDRRKVIMLGPRAQEVLRPWLEREAQSYCVVPAEVSAWHYQRTRIRPSPENPVEQVEPKVLKLRPGSKYTRHCYRVAVQRACKRAGVEPWSPRRHEDHRDIRGAGPGSGEAGHARDRLIPKVSHDSVDALGPQAIPARLRKPLFASCLWL
jgi:integrase